MCKQVPTIGTKDVVSGKDMTLTLDLTLDI
jgi:hypothetical protein